MNRSGPADDHGDAGGSGQLATVVDLLTNQTLMVSTEAGNVATTTVETVGNSITGAYDIDETTDTTSTVDDTTTNQSLTVTTHSSTTSNRIAQTSGNSISGVRALAKGLVGQNELVPVQIPRLAMTNEQLDQVADAIIMLHKQRAKIPPLQVAAASQMGQWFSTSR